MARIQLWVLLSLLATPQKAMATPQTAVYYTSGANWVDIKKATHGGEYNIACAVFEDATGALVSSGNLTDINSLDMGYVAVDARRGRVIFASQPQWTKEMSYNNVELMTVPLNSSKAKTATPLVSPKQAKQLLAKCAGSGGPHGCSQMSQFSPAAGASGLLFALRFWGPPPMGYAVGNQAIAIVRDDGTAAALTWRGTYDAQFTLDLCPRFVPGTDERTVLFVRSVDSGVSSTSTLCLLDVKTLEITKLSKVPFVASKTGCPHFLDDGTAGSGATFIYISSSDQDAPPSPSATDQRSALRKGAVPLPDAYHPFPVSAFSDIFLTAVTVDSSQSPATISWANWWKVPLVDTPDWSDVPEIFQCSQLKLPIQGHARLSVFNSAAVANPAVSFGKGTRAIALSSSALEERLAALKKTTTLVCETALSKIALVKSSEEAGGSFKKLATFKLPFGSDDAASGAWCITADCFQAVSTTTSLSTAGWA